MQLRQPANEGILRYLGRGGPRPAGTPEVRPPGDPQRDYWESGAHPDIVERVWDGLGAGLPEACKQVVFGAPALVEAETGVILAVALGTQYGLRLPPSVCAAGRPAGVRTTVTWSSGEQLDIAEAMGVDWILGGWDAVEVGWCLLAHEEFRDAGAGESRL